MKVFATPSALPVSPPVRREPLTSPPLMSPWHSLLSAGRAAWPARFHLGSLLGMVFEIPLPCLAGSSQARDCCVPGVAGCIQDVRTPGPPCPCHARTTRGDPWQSCRFWGKKLGAAQVWRVQLNYRFRYDSHRTCQVPLSQLV